jgi:hypothetical protein
MSEVQQRRANGPMTSPLSTKENIGVTISPSKRYLKKAFCVSGKTMTIIHQEIVEQLGINEGTWFKQEATNNGIVLTITNFTTEIGAQEKVEDRH